MFCLSRWFPTVKLSVLMDQVENMPCLLEEKWAEVNGAMAEEARVFLDLSYFHNRETTSLATFLGRFYINRTQTGWYDPSSRFGSELPTHSPRLEKNTQATKNSDLGQAVVTLTTERQEIVPGPSREENLITKHYLHDNTLELHGEDLTLSCWFRSNRWTQPEEFRFHSRDNQLLFTLWRLGVLVRSVSPHPHASSGVNCLFVVWLFAVEFTKEHC